MPARLPWHPCAAPQIFSTYGTVQKVHIFEREGKTIALVQVGCYNCQCFPGCGCRRFPSGLWAVASVLRRQGAGPSAAALLPRTLGAVV